MSFWSQDNYEQEFRNPIAPRLTREACLAQKGIRSFLKLSRLASDDTVRQHLNNILDNRAAAATRAAATHKGDPEICDAFVHEYLFAHWRARADVIRFCSDEAAALRRESDVSAQEIHSTDNDVDPRIDPYHARSVQDKIAANYASYWQLQNWLENETTVEGIVRDRSAQVVQDRCRTDVDIRADFAALQQGHPK